MKTSIRATLVFLGAGVVAVALLLFPLAMSRYIRWLGPVDWPTLSNAGQAFGQLATLVSALAFAALAWSIQVQIKEARKERSEVNRSLHMQYWSIAFSDDSLFTAWPIVEGDLETQRRFSYLNLQAWWWHHSYVSGLLGERSLRAEAAALFRGEIGRRYYSERMSRAVRNTRADRRFFEILNDEYRRAEELGPGVPAPNFK